MNEAQRNPVALQKRYLVSVILMAGASGIIGFLTEENETFARQVSAAAVHDDKGPVQPVSLPVFGLPGYSCYQLTRDYFMSIRGLLNSPSWELHLSRWPTTCPEQVQCYVVVSI